MLAAPKNIKTFGDLGEFAFGQFGRYAVNLSQLLNCLLIPVAFLVLGSDLLAVLFPNSLSSTSWIVLMALSLLPFCLKITLKETATSAILGAIGTLTADFIALGTLWFYLYRKHDI